MKPVLLDASALIASIGEEKGKDVVDRHLHHAMISSVNLTEVASYMVRSGMPVGQVRELLKALSLAVIPYDEEQALRAAQIYPQTTAKGLSLGDRACLALAILQGLSVLTADKAWKTLDLDVKIELIR